MSVMSEGEDPVLSLQDVLEEDQQLEETANAVLGDSDDTQCTYTKGYVYRQALYACATCVPAGSPPAGVCLACSLHCHDGHQLHELYTKRLFRCDCGNSKFNNFTCTLNPHKDASNPSNQYNHNFRGLYCQCHRPYPDSEDEVEDEMIQCCVCEDWFHSRHLGGTVPSSYDEMACDSCMKSHDFLHFYQLHTAPVKVTKEPDGGSTSDTTQSSKVNLEVTQGECQEPPAVSGSKGEGSEKKELSSNEGASAVPDDQGASQPESCELKRRKAMAVASGGEERREGAGYFSEHWRLQLCQCHHCKLLYKECGVSYLTEEGDSLSAYEKRAANRPSTIDAGMSALENTLDRVQQVEAFHQYNELKSGLSDYLKQFAQEGKVVSKRDIEHFFEGMEARKRRRLNTGEGVPPAHCHF